MMCVIFSPVADRFSMCDQAKTCCSMSAEMELLDMSVATMRQKFLDTWRAGTATCNSRDFKGRYYSLS